MTINVRHAAKSEYRGAIFMKNSICFRCACVFSHENGDFIECPECHYRIETDAYERLVVYARRAFTYGYSYRMAYEREYLRDRSLSSRYSISVEEIWTFCALAVLSGIIGSTAYDILKAVIRKISDQFKAKGDSNQVKRIIEIVEDPDDFEMLITCIRDYHNGMSTLNPKIREVILEEINTDDLADTITPMIEEAFSSSVKEGGKLQREAVKLLVSQALKKPKIAENTLEKSDFDNFWQLFE